LATLSGFLAIHFEGSLFDGSLADLGAKAFRRRRFRRRCGRSRTWLRKPFYNGGGDFSGFNEFHQFGESGWRDGACGNFFAGIFQAAKSSVCIQLATALPGAPALTTASK